MARPEKIRLGELLVSEKLITHDQLEYALEQQKSNGHKLGRVLVEDSFVTEEQISETLAKQFNIPYIDLENHSINPELVKLLPESQARRFRTLILEEQNGQLLVVMSDPTDSTALEEIQRIVNRSVTAAVVTEGQLLQGIDRSYLHTDEITGKVRKAHKSTGNETNANFAAMVDSFGREDAQVADLLKKLFDDAMHLRASEIHIEPQDGRLLIRFRIDGVLHIQTETDVRIAPALVTRIKLMSGLDVSGSSTPQTGRLHVQSSSQAVGVRVSTMPTRNGDAAVLRLFRQDGALFDLDKLGMPPDLLKRFREIIRRNKGMVLVSGPADSGKTTLLYAALAEINTDEKKIITVEDHVEYIMHGANQVQVDNKNDLSFSRALQYSLLQVPDVIMIGELADTETSQIALRAALEGRMVFSSLCATDSASAVLRLVEMGIPRYMVASSVQAVMAQRLIRQICINCSEPHIPSTQEGEWLKAQGMAPGNWSELRRGRGCTQCNGTGYQGRSGIYELLEMGREAAETITQSDNAQFLQTANRDLHDKKILDLALDQLKQGRTTVSEVMRICA